MRDFLQQNNIEIMSWSALSLNINLIEHLWDETQVNLIKSNQSWTWFIILEGLGSYSYGINQPPHSFNVQEIISDVLL